MYARVMLAALCGTMLLARASLSQPAAAVERYRAGYELLKSRNFRNAAIELEQATSLDSTYANAHFLLGQAYEKLQEYRKAIGAFEAAQRYGIPRERLSKRLVSLHYRFALESFEQRKYTAAIRSFEQVIKLEPGNAEARYSVGLCYSGLKNTEAARRAFEAAAAADPAYAKPHKALGDLFRQARLHEQAKSAYQKALELDSTYTGAYGGLAQIHVEQDEIVAAVSLLVRATRIDPRYGEGFILLGTFLTHLERPEEAVGALAQAVQLHPGNAEAHYRLGEAYFATGQYDRAISTGKAALARDDDYHPAEVLLGDAFAKLGQPEKARSWYSKAMNDSRFKDYCAFKLEELGSSTP